MFSDFETFLLGFRFRRRYVLLGALFPLPSQILPQILLLYHQIITLVLEDHI